MHSILPTEYLYTFISTGEKTALYTLRVMCNHVMQLENGDIQKTKFDQYIQNLSNDKDKASMKGQQLSEEMGLDFRDNADFDLNEIRRNKEKQSQEEREATERAIQERIAWEMAEYERQIREDIILVGKYKGKTPEEVKNENLPYLFWLSTNKEARGPLGVSGKIADNYITLNNVQSPEWLGKENEELKATVLIKGIYPIEGYYGRQFFFKTIEQETGSTLGFYTISKKFLDKEIGDIIEITGIVKDHRKDRNGMKTTILSKPKMIPEPKPVVEKKIRKKSSLTP